MKIAEKAFIVTGGASGIGATTATKVQRKWLSGFKLRTWRKLAKKVRRKIKICSTGCD